MNTQQLKWSWYQTKELKRIQRRWALQRCRFVLLADFSLFGGGRKKLPPVLVIIVEISGVSVMRGHRRVDSKKND